MAALIILYLISWSILMITVVWQFPQTFYRWTKIFTAALFVLIGGFNDRPVIIITLILFFIGDVLLAFADGGKVKRWLLWGMLFFWLGHLGLIVCMVTYSGFSWVSLLFGMVLVGLLLLIKKGFPKIDFRGLFPISMIYAYTLGVLGSMSLSNISSHPDLTLGIMIFIISDICLIFWYFYPKCPRFVKLINVITYFGSVIIIALS
ncbi:MAG: hypothetical protein KMY54_02230 [Erysipelothrix sp.]|nr:hypothetical protein [Erysipelothrix sp.]